MADSRRDRRAEALARGVAKRPTALPGGGEEKPDGSARAAAGRPPKVNRFAYPKVLCRWQRSLTRTQLALAFSLWNRARRDGAAFHVSMATLGRDIGGVAANHVAEDVARLAALGLVVVVRKGCYRTGEATVFRVPESPPEPGEPPKG